MANMSGTNKTHLTLQSYQRQYTAKTIANFVNLDSIYFAFKTIDLPNICEI